MSDLMNGPTSLGSTQIETVRALDRSRSVGIADSALSPVTSRVTAGPHNKPGSAGWPRTPLIDALDQYRLVGVELQVVSKPALSWRAAVEAKDHVRGLVDADGEEYLDWAGLGECQEQQAKAFQGGNTINEAPVDVLGLNEEGTRTVMHRTQPEGSRSGPGDTNRTLYSLRRFVRLGASGNQSTSCASGPR
jgi:hypothetical protein